MADVAVENPATSLTSTRKPLTMDNNLNIDSLEGPGTDGGDEYTTMKRLQRHLEYVISPGLRVTLLESLIQQQIHPAPRRIHQG